MMTSSTFGGRIDVQATHSLVGSLGMAIAMGAMPGDAQFSPPFPLVTPQPVEVAVSADTYTELRATQIVTDEEILQALGRLHDYLLVGGTHIEFEVKEHVSRNIWDHYL